MPLLPLAQRWEPQAACVPNTPVSNPAALELGKETSPPQGTTPLLPLPRRCPPVTVRQACCVPPLLLPLHGQSSTSSTLRTRPYSSRPDPASRRRSVVDFPSFTPTNSPRRQCHRFEPSAHPVAFDLRLRHHPLFVTDSHFFRFYARFIHRLTIQGLKLRTWIALRRRASQGVLESPIHLLQVLLDFDTPLRRLVIIYTFACLVAGGPRWKIRPSSLYGAWRRWTKVRVVADQVN